MELPWPRPPRGRLEIGSRSARDRLEIASMLDGGGWQEHLLVEEFVAGSLGSQATNGGRWNDYGDFWWGAEPKSERASYDADATLIFSGGQFLILVPDLDRAQGETFPQLIR